MVSSTEELRARALEGKSERQMLELKAYWALSDLSGFFNQQASPLFYQVNRLLHQLDEIRSKPLI